jgi:hypothetical protein
MEDVGWWRRRRLTCDLGGLGGVEVGGEPVDVLGVRVEDRFPRLVLAALLTCLLDIGRLIIKGRHC